MSRARLIDLPFAGKELVLRNIPDFDFFFLNDISSILIEKADDSLSVRVVAAYSPPGRNESFEITLLFGGVSSGMLPSLSDSMSFNEVELVDRRLDQLEDIRFELVAEAGDFSISCFDVSILGCQRLETL